MLDGANHLTIYWRIIFPLLKPAIATVAVIKGVFIYNELYIPFRYMPDQSLGVTSTTLFRFKGLASAHWEILSAESSSSSSRRLSCSSSCSATSTTVSPPEPRNDP
jgi:ABC-type glycerol-3-phosphate transport system permease component